MSEHTPTVRSAEDAELIARLEYRVAELERGIRALVAGLGELVAR